jgi:hypothetical protein
MVNKMPITSWEEIQKRRRKDQQEEKKKTERCYTSPPKHLQG